MKHDNYATEADTEELIRIGQMPPALALAEHLERTMQWPLHGKAADELRRLHTLNDELLGACRMVLMLRQLGGMLPGVREVLDEVVKEAEAAIAKAEAKR